MSQALKSELVSFKGLHCRTELDVILSRVRFPITTRPTQINGLPEQSKVRGFPKLVIIDQKGVVRDLHVGSSADLAEEVTKTVCELLAES